MIIDSKLISALKRREKKAFDKVYQEYYRLVYYVALTTTRDEELAQDIMQDTFINFMKNIEDYEHDGKLKQYLTTIARNLSMNAIKDKNRKNESLDDSLLSASVNDDTSEVVVKLTLEKTLSLQDAEIVSLKVLYNYNFREIAEELGLTIGVVQSQYYKAIESLKKYFEKEND